MQAFTVQQRQPFLIQLLYTNLGNNFNHAIFEQVRLCVRVCQAHARPCPVPATKETNHLPANQIGTPSLTFDSRHLV